MTNSKRNSRILWTIVLFLCLLFAVTYGERLAAKARLEASIERQVARVAEAKQRQQALQQQLAYVRSDAYIEEVARNELGMVQRGDEVLIVVKGVSNAAAQDSNVDPSSAIQPPLWQEWLRYLGF